MFNDWLGNACKQLGLSPEFINRLRTDDDWSFVIKAGALMEAALRHVLVERLGEEQLQEEKLQKVFAKMPQYQRIEWAVGLSLLETEQEAFAKKLAEFRNAVVHDVTNVDVNLVRYVSKFDQDKQTSFVDSCRFAFGPGFETDEITGLALNFPKEVLWAALTVVIATLYHHIIPKLQTHDVNVRDGIVFGDDVSAEINRPSE